VVWLREDGTGDDSDYTKDILMRLLQIASYELGKLLPESQRPLPLDLMRIGDSRSDVVPNGGRKDAVQP